MIEQGQRTLPDPVVDESKMKLDLKKMDVKFMNIDADFIEDESTQNLNV